MAAQAGDYLSSRFYHCLTIRLLGGSIDRRSSSAAEHCLDSRLQQSDRSREISSIKSNVPEANHIYASIFYASQGVSNGTHV
jgi:hypothetical protein